MVEDVETPVRVIADRFGLPCVMSNSTVPIATGLECELPRNSSWMMDGHLRYDTTLTAGIIFDLLVPRYARYSISVARGALRGVVVMGGESGVVSILFAQQKAERSNTIFHRGASWFRLTPADDLV